MPKFIQFQLKIGGTFSLLVSRSTVLLHMLSRFIKLQVTMATVLTTLTMCSLVWECWVSVDS